MSSKTGIIAIFILLTLFLLPSVAAFTAQTGKISINACACSVDAVDNIIVENTATNTQSYMITTSGTASSWVSTAKSFILQAGEKKELPILMTAPCDARGQYDVKYTISTQGDIKTLTHIINVNKCQNIDITAKSLSLTTDPCEVTIYELTIHNTGIYPEQYQLTFSGNKDWLTVSENPVSLAAKANKTVYIYALAPCESYGIFDLTAYIETQTSKYITQIPLTLSILRNYSFSVEPGKYDTVTLDNETAYTFIPTDGTYNICEKDEVQIPLKVSNQMHFPNRYTFKLDGTKWGKIVEKSLTVGGEEFGIATLFLEPKLGDVGDYEFNIRTYSQRGKVYDDIAVNVTVDACYFVDVKPIDSLDLCTSDTPTIPIEIENNGAYEENILLTLEGSGCFTIPEEVTVGSKQIETVNIEYDTQCSEIGTRELTLTAVLESEPRVKAQQEFEAELNDLLGCYNTKISRKRIKVTEETESTLTIKNKGTRTIDYDLSVDGPYWITISPETLEVEPKETGEFTLNIDPTDQYSGLYPFKVKAQIGDKIAFSRKSLVIAGTPSLAAYLLHYIVWTILASLLILTLLVLAIIWLRNKLRTYEIHKWKLIEKGSKELAQIKQNMVVTEVVFTAQEELQKTKLRVEQYRRKRTKQKIPDLVYGYFEVEPSFGKHATRDGHIICKVSKKWLAKHKLTQLDVTLKHFTNKWKNVETRKVKSDDNFVYYKLPLDIGHYAITAPRPKVEEKPKPVPKKPEKKIVKKEKPALVKKPIKKKKRLWPWILLGVIVVLILLGIAVYYFIAASRAPPTIIIDTEIGNETALLPASDIERPTVLGTLKDALLSYLPYVIAGVIALLILITLSLLFAGKEGKPKKVKEKPKPVPKKEKPKKVEAKPKKAELKKKKKKGFPWIPVFLAVIIVIAIGVGITNRLLAPTPTPEDVTVIEDIEEEITEPETPTNRTIDNITKTNVTDNITIQPEDNVTLDNITEPLEVTDNVTDNITQPEIIEKEPTVDTELTIIQPPKSYLPYAIAGLLLIMIVMALIFILQPKAKKKPKKEKPKEKPKKVEAKVKPKVELKKEDKPVKELEKKPKKKKSYLGWIIAIIVLIAFLGGIVFLATKVKLDIQSITTGSLGPEDLPNDTMITTYDRDDVSFRDVVRTEPEVSSEDDIEQREAYLHRVLEEMVEEAKTPEPKSPVRMLPLIIVLIILAALILPVFFKKDGKKEIKKEDLKKDKKEIKKEETKKDKKEIKKEETKKEKKEIKKQPKKPTRKGGFLERTGKAMVDFFTEEIEDEKKKKSQKS